MTFMLPVFRIDSGELRPAQRRDDGTLVVDAYITRAGVFAYANKDGSIRREYRPIDEVEKAESLATCQMVAVTVEHPPEMVDAANAMKYTVGSTGENVHMDGEKVRVPLVIFDKAAISAIERGKQETSCGYHVDIDETPGVAPSGEHYDVIQRNIRYNHVALVDRGRAGSNIRLRMDGAIMVDLTRPPAPAAKEDTMDIKELQEKNEKLQFEKAKEQLRADQAETEIENVKSKIEVLTAERDDARDKLEVADAAAKATEETRADSVKVAAALRLKALSVLPASEKGLNRFDDMSDRDIKLAVIEHLSGKRIDAQKSEAYVDARFDAATEGAVPTEAKQAGRVDVAEAITNEKTAQAKQRTALQNINLYYAAKQK